MGGVPLPHVKWVLYPYSSFHQVQCSLRSPWAGIIGTCREVQHFLRESTWDHHRWGCSAPLIWSQKECSHYCCCATHPLASGYWNVQARFGGPTSRSSGLPRHSGSTLHLQLLTLSTLSVLGPLMAVAVEHLLPTRVVPNLWGLGDQPHPQIPLVNRSLPPSKYFLQGWIKQHFLLKAVHLPPRA